MIKGKLYIYDTSNFVDFPIGGQLTSIRSFLKYLAECQPEVAARTTLIGVTADDAHKMDESGAIIIHGFPFRYVSVAGAEIDQNHPRRSLRLEYLKGLIRYRRNMSTSPDDLHFIHTPEAFLAVRLFLRGKTAVFSHGSFVNMKDSVRFYAGSPVASLFQRYLTWVVRHADRIFVLDRATYDSYRALNSRVHLVTNSIVGREKVERCVGGQLRLLFVGRLSAVKNVLPIVAAAEQSPLVASLLVVGAGEEYERLRLAAGPKTTFAGPLPHEAVMETMRSSDVLVMNSRHEGVPMTIIEAMSVGLPVITTNVGAIGETVEFGLNAIMTDGSVQSIIWALEAMGRDYNRLSDAAFAGSLRFDYSTVGARVFEALCETGPEDV